MQGAVLEPEELAEVVAPGRALIRLGRGDHASGPLSSVGDREMLVADALPVRRPVAPIGRRSQDPIEIVHVDPIRNEPRLPVTRRNLDAIRCLDGHRSPRSRRSATADR